MYAHRELYFDPLPMRDVLKDVLKIAYVHFRSDSLNLGVYTL